MNILPHGIALAVGRAIGSFFYYTGLLRKGIVKKNLRIAFGDEMSSKERKDVIHKFYRNMFMNGVEFARASKIDRDFIDKYVYCDPEDLKKLDRALAKNKGLTLLTGHVGNWEMFGIFFGVKGYKLHSIARAISGKVFNNLIIKQRMISGNEVIDKNNALIKMVRVYKRNGIIGILLDQRTSQKEGVVVEFFGKPALTSKALGAMSRKMAVPIIPVFLTRNRDNPFCHTVHIGDEIKIIKTDDADSDLKINTQKFNDEMEKIIRQFPEQWFWFHSRWEKSDNWFKRYRSRRRRSKGYRSDKYKEAGSGDK